MWQLQAIAAVVVGKLKQEVASAFMTSVVVCNLYKGDKVADFYAGFIGFFNLPILYFSWSVYRSSFYVGVINIYRLICRADAYPYTLRFKGQCNIQKTKTFIDAMVCLCLGTRLYPSVEMAISYVRPNPIEHFIPVNRVPYGNLTISASRSIIARAPNRISPAYIPTPAAIVVVAGDSEDSDNSSNEPQLQVEDMIVTTPEGSESDEESIRLGALQPEQVGSIPSWVMEVFADESNETGALLTVKPLSLRLDVLLMLIDIFLELILVHGRGINGEILRTHTTCPTGVILVPSLGVAADRLVDAYGLSPSMISRIHSTYITSRQAPYKPNHVFIKELGRNKMPLLEAAILWDMIKLNLGDSFVYRERFSLGVE